MQQRRRRAARMFAAGRHTQAEAPVNSTSAVKA